MAVIRTGSGTTIEETAAERNARLQAAFNKASTSTKRTNYYVPATQEWPPKQEETPAAKLAQTFTAPAQPFVRRPVDPIAPPPAQTVQLEGPLAWQVPSIPQPLSAPYQDERQYDLSGRFGTPASAPPTVGAQTTSTGFVRRPVEPVATSALATSTYQGPTGWVGPNEIVVEDLADVALTRYQNPDANIFYADPTTGQLTAKAGIMAFVPALNQYLAGEDIPDSVVQTLIDLGLLDDSGAATAVGDSLSSGASSGGSRTSFYSGSPTRFGGTRGAALGLVNWRI